MLITIAAVYIPFYLQWNLNIMKGQGTGKYVYYNEL